MRDFVTKVVVPNGIFYLDDAEFDAARRRLTLPEMAEQLRRDEAMLAAPGPAASALAKEFLRDPLRLHEFIERSSSAAKPIKTYQNSDAFLSADGRSLLDPHHRRQVARRPDVLRADHDRRLGGGRARQHRRPVAGVFRRLPDRRPEPAEHPPATRSTA